MLTVKKQSNAVGTERQRQRERLRPQSNGSKCRDKQVRSTDSRPEQGWKTRRREGKRRKIEGSRRIQSARLPSFSPLLPSPLLASSYPLPIQPHLQITKQAPRNDGQSDYRSRKGLHQEEGSKGKPHRNRHWSSFPSRPRPSHRRSPCCC